MMPSQTNEQALEQSIEKKLTGTSQEDLKEEGIAFQASERQALYSTGNGYYIGEAADFNKKFAIDEIRF